MMGRLYQFISILSLDVSIGACIGSIFIAEFLEVHLSWAVVTILGLIVWLIYTFDHLMDAKSTPHKASTVRHRFHQEYFKLLTGICVFIFLTVAILVFFIPVETLLWGVSLGSLILGYFLLLYFLKARSSYHKEIIIAVLYTSGIMVGPLSIYHGELNTSIVLLFVQFSLLAFSNLIIFALYELEADERDNFPSVIRVFGQNRMDLIIKILLVAQIIGAGLISLNSNLRIFECTLLVMICVLILIAFNKVRFLKGDRYRLLGDAIFLLPLFTIIFVL